VRAGIPWPRTWHHDQDPVEESEQSDSDRADRIAAALTRTTGLPVTRGAVLAAMRQHTEKR